MAAGGPDGEGVGSRDGASSRARAGDVLKCVEPPDAPVLAALWAFVGGADCATLGRQAELRGTGTLVLVEALARLIDEGLVEVTAPDGVARYRLAQGVRPLVEERLGPTGVLAAAVSGHLAWCQELAAELDELHRGDGLPSGALERYGVEQANLEAGLDAALRLGAHQVAPRLALALCPFWELRGPFAPARRQLRRILQRPLERTARIRLLDGLGTLALRQGADAEARALFSEALRLAGEHGDATYRARLRWKVGLAVLSAGDVAAARGLVAPSLVELEDLGAAFELGRAEAAMAFVELAEGRLGDARSRFERATALQLAVGDRLGSSRSMLGRSMALLLGGSHAQALEDAAAVAQLFLRLGDEGSGAEALLVAAGAIGDECFELALEVTGASRRLLSRSATAIPSGWGEQLDAALAPARRRAAGRADELARRGAALAPAALLDRLLDASRGEAATGRVELRALGRFEVRRDGGELHLPPQPARLVKLVVLHPEGVHVEQAIELLWPEVPSSLGRRRLRNVLARLSRVAGTLVVRRADTLALAPGVALDVARFEAAARDAIGLLRAGEARWAALWRARAANELYTGDLLAEDRYEDFAVAARERLRRLRLRLLDAASETARAEGDLAVAETCLRLALDADPADEGRYVALARLLLHAGRLAPAGDLCARARGLAQELGLRVSPAVRELEQAVARQASECPRAGFTGQT